MTDKITEKFSDKVEIMYVKPTRTGVKTAKDDRPVFGQLPLVGAPDVSNGAVPCHDPVDFILEEAPEHDVARLIVELRQRHLVRSHSLLVSTNDEHLGIRHV